MSLITLDNFDAFQYYAETFPNATKLLKVGYQFFADKIAGLFGTQPAPQPVAPETQRPRALNFVEVTQLAGFGRVAFGRRYNSPHLVEEGQRILAFVNTVPHSVIVAAEGVHEDIIIFVLNEALRRSGGQKISPEVVEEMLNGVKLLNAVSQNGRLDTLSAIPKTYLDAALLYHLKKNQGTPHYRKVALHLVKLGANLSGSTLEEAQEVLVDPGKFDDIELFSQIIRAFREANPNHPIVLEVQQMNAANLNDPTIQPLHFLLILQQNGNDQDENEKTYFHRMLEGGGTVETKFKAAHYLVALGLDHEIPDRNGVTPLDLLYQIDRRRTEAEFSQEA